MASKFYLTTTLPYVNAEPHIGFALEIIQADVITRFKALQGSDFFFNTGTDEHGLKIYRKAIEEGKTPKAYCDEYAAKFDDLKKALNLNYNNFIRTTDPHHKKSAQEFWKKCSQKGDIYKKNYQIKYCVGCELEKQDSELENNFCPLHPKTELELIEEENYFFRFSKYQNKLLELYQKYPDFVVPDGKLKEISSFVSAGLQDFSISRMKSKMPWGVAVPGDDEQVMYVWFDALINYISALGWPEDKNKFVDFWGTNEKPNALQIAGKDNLRQQSAMWQAMLMSADLPTSRQVLIHGYLTLEGQKISKSLGNTVNPIEEAEKYGVDALRYYLLAEISPFGDSDYSRTGLVTRYNSHLANGIGNLVSRISTMCENSGFLFPSQSQNELDVQVTKYMDSYQYNQTLDYIWETLIRNADRYITENKVWEMKDENLKFALDKLVNEARNIAYNLQPFLPETSEKILKQFSGPEIKSTKPLFPRIS